MQHTRESLIDFRDCVRNAFLEKRIRSPIHLPGGNEDQLLDIFQRIKPTDFVFSNWRSMYHALLHGIPEDALFDMILNGRSMFICSKAHRFYSSSIVAGTLPIACGVAMGIKRKGLDDKIWVFVGDMSARCGLFHEFHEYCGRHDLPVHIVIEDNGISTGTPTAIAWGDKWPREAGTYVPTERYSYEQTTPHVGCGSFVQF